jgi:hypothetical protein
MAAAGQGVEKPRDDASAGAAGAQEQDVDGSFFTFQVADLFRYLHSAGMEGNNPFQGEPHYAEYEDETQAFAEEAPDITGVVGLEGGAGIHQY